MPRSPARCSARGARQAESSGGPHEPQAMGGRGAATKNGTITLLTKEYESCLTRPRDERLSIGLSGPNATKSVSGNKRSP